VRRHSLTALWVLIAAEWIAIIVFPAHAHFFEGYSGWLLGVLTGWLWRDTSGDRHLEPDGSAVEKAMAAQARELKRGTRRRRWALARFFRVR
jgi:hypothetical protein